MTNQLTLTELNSLIKETLELSFPEQLWVVAEIGELKVNRTGHCYLELVEKNTITDEITARSRATIWSWQFRFIQPYFETTTGQSLQAGIKVLVAVSIEFHEVYGMSLNIKDIDPNYTLGDMARKRQEVINRLMEEGVFDMNKEVPLAEIPSRIAIISSPTAAGYEDFMNQLHQNEAGYKFYAKLFPAVMQGSEAAQSIIHALEFIYDLEDLFDTVVIIRGGGSQLDLSCFDDYNLALNITQFPLPILTGIGHEKDESVADMVAHKRLKTPTAVAEFLISCFDEIAAEIHELEIAFFDEVEDLLKNEENRLNQALKLFKPIVKSRLEKTDFQLKRLAQNIRPATREVIEKQQFKLVKFADHLEMDTTAFLKEKLNHIGQLASKTSYLSNIKQTKADRQLNEMEHMLHRITNRRIENEKSKLDWLEKTKNLVDPKHILKRGFSITLKDGKAVKSAQELGDGDELTTILYDGKIKTTVKT